MANQARSVLLAEKWDESTDPSDWWISEKLDGVRAYWDGSRFYSRQGNVFEAPKFFKKDLPKVPLDGELWCGRGLFQKCISIVKKKKENQIEKDWNFVTYLIFDAPSHGGPYEQRVKWLKDNIQSLSQTGYAAVVGVVKCKGKDHLKECLQKVEEKGGEGLMLRQPGSPYVHGRSSTLLKVKTMHDEEAKVIGYKKGEGRLLGMVGGLICVLPNGIQFNVGSGLDDALRRRPPKVGTVITFKYQEISDEGHPRFPVYLRERTDMSWEDVLESAKTKTPFSQLKKKTSNLSKQHSILFSTVPSRDQITGDKIVTDDDIDDDAEEEIKPSKKEVTKPKCKYWEKCFRQDESHLNQFEHPPKQEIVLTKPAVPVPCKFGAACWLTAKAHLQRYTHPEKEKVKEEKPEDEHSDEEDTITVTRKDYENMLKMLKDQDYQIDALEKLLKKALGETTTLSLSQSSGKQPAPEDSSAPSKKKSPTPQSSQENDTQPLKESQNKSKYTPSEIIRDEIGSDDEGEKSDLPVCHYGESCHRKNPDHFKQFSHPHLKKRKVEEEE